MSKRIISLLLAFVICISVVPVCYADSGGTYISKTSTYYDRMLHGIVNGTSGVFLLSSGIQGIAAQLNNDICALSSDGYHYADSFFSDRVGEGKDGARYAEAICKFCGEVFLCYASDISSSYDDYVSELPATGYNSDGSLLIKTEILEHGYSSYGMSSIYYGCNSHTEARPPQGATVRLSCASDAVLYSLASGYEYFRVSGSFFTAQSLTAPYDGFYQLISSPQCVVKYNLVSGEAGSLSGDFSGWDSRTYFNAGSSIMNSVRCAFYGTDSLSINNLHFFSAHVQFFPRVYKFTPAPSVDVNFETTYNITTRPTSITGGNYGIVGDNGQITRVEGNTIVNETNNTYYNPSTGTTVPIVDWSYDYSDRSYKVTLESGDTVTVTYGDENVTIQEGDTVYNVYYLADGSGTEQPPEVCAHEWSETSRTDPTCTVAGQAVSTCSKCQEVKTEPVPALGHDWQVKQSVKTEYDDTGQLVQKGYTIYECSRCQEQYKGEDGIGPPDIPPEAPGEDEDKKGFLAWLWDVLTGSLKKLIEGVIDAILKTLDFFFGGDGQSNYDFYNSPSTFSGVNVWAS